MSAQTIVYKTYIKTTPEKLWDGLTNREFTKRYWDMEFVTDWTAGSSMTWIHHGVTITDPEQVVIESDPYRRLSYTWHTFSPDLMRQFGMADDVAEGLRAERRSKVTFEIEDLSTMVKLTVLHDDFDPDSVALTMVSEGWPHVLSDLKTLLETGEVLDPAK
jgi:uncharacterized protein YndB with AHSA1/START domain